MNETRKRKITRRHLAKAWRWLESNRGLVIKARSCAGIRKPADYGDICSEVFMAIARCFASFDEDMNSSFANYAFISLRWSFYSQKKRFHPSFRFGFSNCLHSTLRPKRTRMPELLDDTWADYDRANEIDEWIHFIKNSTEIDARWKRIMELRHFKGYETKRIAGFFGISVVRVHQIMQRGCRAAHEVLCREGFDIKTI